jgi:preprotein translocase subunit YajC
MILFVDQTARLSDDWYNVGAFMCGICLVFSYILQIQQKKKQKPQKEKKSDELKDRPSA